MLKSAFFSGNAVQTLSHALALYPGDPVVKAQRTLDLFRELKSRGQRWDTSYALPLLGVIAMTSNDQQAILSEVLDASDWLKTQPGFGFWSSIGSPMRLMYAGMMVNSAIAADSNTNLTSMLTSSIITLIAQQAAMSAAIATNTATH